MDRDERDHKGKNFMFENKLKYTKADGVTPRQIQQRGFNPDNYYEDQGYIIPKIDCSKITNLTFEERNEIVKQKRAIEEEARQKYKIFCLLKSGALQAFRQQEMNKARAILRTRQRAQKMVNLVKTRKLMKKAWKTITQRIENHKNQRRINFMTQCIWFKTRRILKKRGATFEDRLKKEISNTIALSTSFTYPDFEERAFQTVNDFLTRTATIEDLRESITDFNTHVVWIQ